MIFVIFDVAKSLWNNLIAKLHRFIPYGVLY